jgi:hypothetical protein
MICKHCGITVESDDQQGGEGRNLSSDTDSSACKSCVEVEYHENAIARLKIKRSELKRNINRSHSPFIRLIPPEAIARISEFASIDFKSMGSLAAVILLSSVCSDWRRAVVETPHFWTSIKIDLPSISQKSDMASSILLYLAIFIDEWLVRSGQLPLSISLSDGYDVYHDESSSSHLEGYRPIFKILNQNSFRWHSLDISIHPTLLPFLQPDCLPLLEQLHITFKPDAHHAIAFPPTPRLNTVKIRACKTPEFLISSGIGIQWDTVTHVSLNAITSRSCFALLRLNPQLVHCTFHNVYNDDEDQLPESPIHSSLTYLSMHHRQNDSSQILDNIKLPCLETLVLLNMIVDPVIAFLKRSACSLQTLSVQNWHFRKPDNLVPLLQFLSPSLTRLAISRNPSPMRATRHYLSLLAHIYTSQSEVVGNDFLPHLEIFDYREESRPTLKSSMLLNSESRNHPKVTTSISLRSVYISRARMFIPDDLQRLQEDGILTYNVP